VSRRRPLLRFTEMKEIKLTKAESAERCLELLKSLHEKLEQTGQWEELREEIEALIGELEETLIPMEQKNSENLNNLLLTAATIIRLILNLP